jgi:multisubunit Na+/H+ antiporter MnhB subunit
MSEPVVKDSFLLEQAAKILTPLIVILSLWVLYRGHNEPGGGFIGGLMAASAIGFWSIAFGPERTRQIFPWKPHRWMSVGVAVSLIAGIWSWFVGDAFLTGQWTTFPHPEFGIKVGTPLLFDIGVYITVISVTVSMLLVFEED